MNFINLLFTLNKRNELASKFTIKFTIKRFISLFLIGLLFLLPTGFASTSDSQLWTNIVATLPLINKKPQLRSWLEIQERIGEDASQLSQLIFRPGLGYQLTPFTSIWLGYAWIHTAPPFTTESFVENRMWQQLLWSNEYSQVRITARSRLEERFISRNIHTGWRYRQLVRAAFTIPRHDKHTFILSDELFFHLNDFNHNNNDGFDQNRFFMGLGYQTSKQSTVEAGYLNQKIRRVNDERYNGHNLLLTLTLNQ